jgi:hypothetical protein
MVKIPDWMEKSAPGAAGAASTISRGNLTEAKRQRLARLTGEDTRHAWLEPLRRRQKSKKELSADELWAAHHELMFQAFRAPDSTPIGRLEIERAKLRLERIGTAAQDLAKEICEVSNDAQLEGIWSTYRSQRPYALANLPDRLPSLTVQLVWVADFFRRATTHYKPEGPVPPVGQPKDRDALKTTVIRQIAQTCLKHFNTGFPSTVATLANAALNCTDINRDSVRGSLRSARRDRD